MSTFMPVECKCAICGAVNAYRVVASTNSFGSPDLDLRPAEMQRSTMPSWIQECPSCGYVAYEVSDSSCVTKEWLRSGRYLSCDGINFSSGLAVQFYKLYLISLEDKKIRNAFSAIHRAAWACDDELDKENAITCRKKAIALIDELMIDQDTNKDTLLLIKADLLRRAMLFEQLITEYSSVQFQDKLLNQILAFQIQKARQKDPYCYRLDNVT